MLESISWSQFGICIAGAMVVYFGFLFVTGKLMSKGNTSRQQHPPQQENRHSNNFMEEQLSPMEEEDQNLEIQEQDITTDPISNTEDNLHEQTYRKLEKLADDVQEIIVGQGRTIERQEIIKQLENRIMQEPELNRPAFRSAINHLIIKTGAQFEITISAEEAEALWNTP